MVWTIISVLVFAVGLILLLVQSAKRQVELGFANLFVTTGVSLITGSFGTLTDELFASLRGTEVENDYFQFGAGVLLMLSGAWMSFYIKNKLSILNLIGIKERRIEEHRKDIGLNQFEFKEREIDLSMYSKKEMNYDRYEDAVKTINDALTSFKAENKDVKIGYTGTAPIPLTIFAGYCAKGQPTSEFFEYVISERKFEKLQPIKQWYQIKKVNYPKLQLQTPINNLNIMGTEVVLGVSTTFRIQDSQVGQFGSPFAHLAVPATAPNTIKYEEQLMEYVEDIFQVLMELSQLGCIQKIHLVISSQSCLVFELGKRLTTLTYMKEVISYHFVANANPPYPWGISFNNNGTKLIC